MRIWSKVVFDIETWELLNGECQCYEYDGPVAELKGAGVAQAQQQQELGMQQQAFNTQMAQLSQLQSSLSPYLAGQTGYSPQLYGAMQSQFLANNAQQFQNAGQAVRQALLARGGGMGDMPASGDYTRGISSLMGAAASSQAQGILGLQQANAQQALANQFNAAGLLTNQAGLLGQTQGVAGQGASNALNAYVQAANSGLMSQFMRGLGSGLGGGLGAMATGGLASAAGGIAGMLGNAGGGGFQGGIINPGGSFGSGLAPSLSSVGAMPSMSTLPSSVYG